MNTIEPGWYVDYQNPNQMRFHDGTAWTEHVHAGHKNLPPAPVAITPPMPGDAAPTNTGARSTNLISVAVVGVFVGLLFGGFLFNGAGSLTPTTEHAGTLENIRIDYSNASGASPDSRRSHILSGSTEAGADWRIVDEEAYRVVEAEGYPQDVVVAIGDWTGTAERVTGASFTVDHQTTGARLGWGAVLGAIGLASLAGSVLIARSKSTGVPEALLFLVALFGPGAWLGFQAFQWVQSA